MIFRQNLEEMLSDLEKKQKLVSKELSQCLPGVLMQCQRNGKPEFIHVIKENEKRVRRSINSHPDIIAALARKKYLETELALLEQNITAVKSALTHFCDTTAEQVLKKMPLKYRNLSQELFFKGTKSQLLTPADKWAQEPYKQSSFLPERKIHLTSRGLAVRSKSEVLIAEKLYEFNVPFRYEQILTIGKHEFAPDFTLLAPREEIMYLEHCGMPANPEYMKRHKWKMDMYESVGIVPWKNLIVTYDDEQGNINLKLIEAEIKSKLL